MRRYYEKYQINKSVQSFLLFFVYTTLWVIEFIVCLCAANTFVSQLYVSETIILKFIFHIQSFSDHQVIMLFLLHMLISCNQPVLLQPISLR